MLRPSRPDIHETDEAIWRDVERMLDETAQLALRAPSAEEFQRIWLSRTVQAVAASGGTLWRLDGSGRLSVLSAQGALEHRFVESESRDRHAATLLAQLQQFPCQPSELAITVSGSAHGPPASQRLLVMPLGDERERYGVVEVLLPCDAASSAGRSRANVLAAFAEVATDFFRQQRVGELRSELELWEGWEESILQLHGHSDQRATSFALADVWRRSLDCDRVIVLGWRRGRLRVMSISGLADFDPRAAAIQAVERLAGLFAESEEPVWYAEGEPLDESTASILGAYVDHVHVRAAGIVPLCAARETADTRRESCAGLVVCERFDGRGFTPGERSASRRLSRHGAVALAQAAELEKLPLIGWSRLLRRLGWGTRPAAVLRAAGAALLATILIAVGGVWPVEFAVRADGVLRPVEQRHIFAPFDGVVREIHVEEGDRVQAGDIVLLLHNDELELELTRLYGELQTARRQYQSVQASRLDAARPAAEARLSAESRLNAGQLAAEEERLKEVVRGLETQHARRLAQRAELQVRSPATGQLLTWDIERTLRSRPVQRGQRLMTVADVGGPWCLELRVADADVGHVANARQDESSLLVTYRLASAPGQDRTATLSQVADWTDPHDEAGPAVRMIAKVHELDSRAMRPGSTVAARIHLGQRPRAYVWFHDLVEFARVQFWW